MSRRVAELAGVDLDYWVARARGTAPRHIWMTRLAPDAKPICTVAVLLEGGGQRGEFFRPTTDWSQGGPIIEKSSVSIGRRVDMSQKWSAFVDSKFGSKSPHDFTADTPLVAAMRAYVASVYGATVPEEP